jgi:hypothetical protein
MLKQRFKPGDIIVSKDRLNDKGIILFLVSEPISLFRVDLCYTIFWYSDKKQLTHSVDEIEEKYELHSRTELGNLLFEGKKLI